MYITLGLIIFLGMIVMTQFFCGVGLLIGGFVEPMTNREKVFWGIMTLLTMSITVPMEIWFFELLEKYC